ncbi:ureidoglycolate lyase [Caproiciproducens sp.]
MRKIKVQELSVAAFAPFGSYVSVTDPKTNNLGEGPCTFYRDPVSMHVSPSMELTFSILKVQKPEKIIVKASEYHNFTAEAWMPVNDDAILYVAPASNLKPVPEETVAFYVPQGTLVKMNTGVWHYAPVPVHKEFVNHLIVLPERTYANDCHEVQYDEADWIEIEV